MKLRKTLLSLLLLPPLAPLPAVEPATVQLNGQQCIKFNGKLLFPIGIYSTSTADFPTLATVGFNLVHSYGWDHKSNADVRARWEGKCPPLCYARTETAISKSSLER